MASRLLLLLLLEASFLFLLSWRLALGQAPGDFDPNCRTAPNFVQQHIFPEAWELLLDNYDYSKLFAEVQGAADPVWLARSFDTDGGANNFEQTVGGTCMWSIRSCTFSGSPQPQNNWLFTQYISYNSSIEVFLNASFAFRQCTDTCTPYITLYKYDTDGIRPEGDRTDPGNYRPLFGTEENSRLEHPGSNLVVEVTRGFTRPTDSEGFYLAFRDIGTCVQIDRFILYYRVVRGFTENFISCPDVPVPVVGSDSTSMLSCVCLGDTSGVGSLERTCDQSGACTEGQRCECSPGFEYNVTSNSCTMCPVETFKAEAANSSCQSCPALSEARDMGAAICECIPPNSRAGSDGAEVACRDRRLSTSAAVAITFFVTLIIVGVAAFLGGGVVAYVCRERIEKVV